MVSKKKNVKNVAQLAKGTQEAAYVKFLPVAREIPKDRLLVAYDAELALQNVKAGADKLLAHPDLDKLASLLTADDIRETVELAEAGVFAANLPLAEDSVLADLRAEGGKLRKILLTAAESAATVGLVPEKEVAEIAKGRGPLDAANDCVQLAALFRRYEAELAGETVVKPEHVERAAEVGSELVRLLKPKGFRKARKLTVTQEDRSRLWTLLVERHEWMRRCAPVVVGLATVDQDVPSLRSQLHKKPASEGKPEAGKPTEATGETGKPTETTGEKPSSTGATANAGSTGTANHDAKPGE